MAQKPNLLFIFTDEQRFDTLKCYGNDFVEAPNLNAFSESAFVFEHPYVSQPVCTPARSTIMTGLYPHSNGCATNNIPLREDVPTLAEMVSDAYTRAYFGKWHLGNEVIAQHGFDQWVSIEDNYREYYSKPEYLDTLSDYHHFLIRNGFEPDREAFGASVFGRGKAADLPLEYTKAGFLGQEAARFLRTQGDDPFVLYVNFLEPHAPFTGPLNDMYDPDAIPVGPHFLEPPSENVSQYNLKRYGQYLTGTNAGQDLSTEAGWRKLRAQYLGLVTQVDRAVGEILTALDESGKADETVVVYTSDHGDMMGDHRLLTKGVLYEESVKVPFLIRVPGLEGRRISGRFGQIDLVPTLLDLLGEPIPDHLQGKSCVDVLRGDANLDNNDVFIEWNQEGNSWRTIMSAEGWKLNVSPHDRCELYDLNSDPYEQKNVCDDADQQSRVQDLIARIRDWQERTGDSVAV